MMSPSRSGLLKGAFWIALIALLWWAIDAFPPPNTSTEKTQPVKKTIYMGNMNGVELSIPAKYLRAIEYTDKSIWEPNKGKDYYKNKNYKSSLRNFAMYLQWPELKPHSLENDKSYYAANGIGHNEWFMMEVISWPMTEGEKDARQIEPKAIGWAEKLVKKNIEGPSKRRLPEGVSYKDYGVDSSIGLHLLRPTGKKAEKREMWNDSIYWSVSKNTFITCPNGAYAYPEAVGLCTQHFLIPEWQANVAVTYLSLIHIPSPRD